MMPDIRPQLSPTPLFHPFAHSALLLGGCLYLQGTCGVLWRLRCFTSRLVFPKLMKQIRRGKTICTRQDFRINLRLYSKELQEIVRFTREEILNKKKWRGNDLLSWLISEKSPSCVWGLGQVGNVPNRNELTGGEMEQKKLTGSLQVSLYLLCQSLNFTASVSPVKHG